jgi:hypothetical protein
MGATEAIPEVRQATAQEDKAAPTPGAEPAAAERQGNPRATAERQGQALATAERRDKAPEAEGRRAAPTAAREGAERNARP